MSGLTIEEQQQLANDMVAVFQNVLDSDPGAEDLRDLVKDLSEAGSPTLQYAFQAFAEITGVDSAAMLAQEENLLKLARAGIARITNPDNRDAPLPTFDMPKVFHDPENRGGGVVDRHPKLIQDGIRAKLIRRYSDQLSQEEKENQDRELTTDYKEKLKNKLKAVLKYGLRPEGPRPKYSPRLTPY